MLLAAGGAAAFLLMGSENSKPVIDADGAEVARAEQPVEMDKDPIYVPLQPAFVVNFEHNGNVRYLQLTLQAMAYEQSVVDKVEANMPAVRNKLILLFSGQDFDSLKTMEGKENLRKEVLDSINQVVRLTTEPKVSDVFFTGFVMQ